MWIPKTEEDINAAATNRGLQETVTFEAKREIPEKNIETAKDVSALANTSGGILVYGLDEDASGCPCVLNPIALANQRERIDQIVRTSVDEVPAYSLSTISTQADSTKGYLIVVVPPSDRAPHMVIVKGERRFYGRGETGNYVLNQAEVSRLYERRQQARSATAASILEPFVNAPPIPENDDFSHLYLVIKPVLIDDALLTKAHDPNSGLPMQDFLSNLISQVRNDETVYGASVYAPDFNPPAFGWNRYPDNYFCKMSHPHEKSSEPDSETLNLQVNIDGIGYLFCGRAAQRADGEKYFLRSVVEGNTSRFLAMFSRLYDKSSYLGMVDIGLHISRLQGCINFESRQMFRHRRRKYDGPDYRKLSRVSTLKVREQPLEIAQQLVAPLFDSLQ